MLLIGSLKIYESRYYNITTDIVLVMARQGLARVRATRPGAQVVLLKKRVPKIFLSKNVLFNIWISLNSQKE